MPLLKGKKNIGHNIEEMEASGHKHSQAVAAALHEAGESKKKGSKIKKAFKRFGGHPPVD